MSRMQIIPTRRAHLADLQQCVSWLFGAPAARSTPMGGRVIPLAGAMAPMWMAALLVSPMLAVGLAAMV